MSPLQIVLDDLTKRASQNEQTEQTTEPRRNPFGASDSSDSEDERPKIRQISSLSTARPPSPPKKPSPAPLPAPMKTGPKGSQIACLVARRNDAAAELGNQARNSRDEALFRYDVDRCDDETSAEGYAKRPVEGFGDLMLRSMGWSGATEEGDAAEPTPRPSRLGLGAKMEDLPPGLPRKGTREKARKASAQRTSDVARSHDREIRRPIRERSGIVGTESGRSDGVTADSSGWVHGSSERTDRVSNASGKPGGDGSNSRRRRKRSRFSDDPER